jgi:hypothetical protein
MHCFTNSQAAVCKPGSNLFFERPKRRWEDNIRMVLKEIGWEGVDCGLDDASGSG